MATKPRAVRIWICHQDSFVRITLRPGKTIAFTSGGPCDEGYSYTHESYTLENGVVECEITTEARDCDGRLDRYWRGEWPVGGPTRDAFVGWHSNGDGVCDPSIQLPEWEPTDRSQRDYAAEAAGY